MPVDPGIAALLAQMPPFNTALRPEEVRAAGEARRQPGLGDRSVATLDRTVPGGESDVPARLYTPSNGSEPRGLLVFFHGGGFVLGNLDSHDGTCRDLAAKSGSVVLAIDYRLAPEHPFPAAVEDAWSALRWAYEHAAELGAAPGRVAVGGDSAGGNLAAVSAIFARDAGLDLRLQLLVYPTTDMSQRRPSVSENGKGYVLSEESMNWFEGHYAPDRTDWRASPMLAPDHSNLAPAVVFTCEYDPLRDEGNDYAATLQAAGVQVLHRCYPGLVHGVIGMSSVVPAAGVVLEDASKALRDALAEP